ncbi:Tetrapyrrole (Corrin/Porphyrin) Methylase [Aquisphaera giovannonii]|uniref:Tetrapyrrole (Corrin/Porphyrin) Methylase n=1 Tax=Aquisphaera giovannonii TaxID=406548 RepID=A0A5B9W3T6_9BACT|nr:SAM-dependent methyltransferase [Aquisphaera giovannonii]QEH34849.1 Tetrapyrrole (Corrin/Porphyrin) Methylase [Aquisphaera giovannonii]
MTLSAGRGGGALVAVGTGIRIVGQLTTEAIAWMRRADRLLYVVNDAVAEATIRGLNPAAESLFGLYAEGSPRHRTYLAMVGRILDSVRAGGVTCAVTYGHPGVFAWPIHEAIRLARAEGYPATMLPAVSAEDCLFADLGVDPARHGCQSYEATDFLLHRRSVDVASDVILWQVGAVGDPNYHAGDYDLSLLPLLSERLARIYPEGHLGYVYEAAVHPGADPYISPVPLGLLHQARLSSSSTLYIPAARAPEVDAVVRDRLEALASGPFREPPPAAGPREPSDDAPSATPGGRAPDRSSRQL